MEKQQLRDVIIVLPGISGSILSRKGVDIWSPSVGCAFRMTGGAKALTLVDESGDPTKPADEVEATGLVPDIHVLPGLWKIDGYSTLVSALEKTFHTVKAWPGEDKCANLIVFPYDWRRDNRINAKRLEVVANSFLSRWRKDTFFKDAKLILIAHSMGGLISRHYLDVLEGWPNCRALFTFGTPFRGSLNALDSLANGVRKLGGLINLTEALRSMTAVYQLLPRYECVLHQNAYHRICEIASLPNIVNHRAADALDFYQRIDDAVKDRGRVLGYDIFPYAGIHQTTRQSAEAGTESVRILEINPPKIPAAYEEGDGTVPLVSAIPAELSEKAEFVTYVNERHAALQANSTVLDDLMRRLIAIEVPGLKAVLGGVTTETTLALKLDVRDVYEKKEQVVIRVSIKDAPSDAEVTLSLENAQTQRASQVPLTNVNGGWQAAEADLDPGSYRVEASARSKTGTATVHDVFVVAEKRDAL